MPSKILPDTGQPEAGPPRPPVHARPWPFFALAFGLSWLFWIPAALLGRDVMSFPFVLLMYAGGIGPALAEFILILRLHDRTLWRDYWQRVFDLRRIGPGWAAVIFLTVPALNALAILLDLAAGGSLPPLGETLRFLAAPWEILPFALFIFLFGPLPEELGWRGVALDALQARWNALSSSLILGLAWAAWHLPLFFMPGTYQHELGFGSLQFWTFVLSTLVSSLLYTWLYNNTRRSTLSAILFHFMVNFSGELMPLNERARIFSLVLLALVALGVTLRWGSETLSGRPTSRLAAQRSSSPF